MTVKLIEGLLREQDCLNLTISLKSENVATLDRVITLTLTRVMEKTVSSDNDDSDDSWPNPPQCPPILPSLCQRSSQTPKTHFGKC